MSVRVVEAATPRERRAWVRFAFDHYRGHPRYVPQILSDEIAYFDPRRNPAFDVSAVRLLTALRDGEPVGRVCGIVNPLEAEKLGHKVGRFGWFESVEDEAVSEALLGTLADWMRAEGCARMTGPQGFTDLDPEGLLVEGHDLVPTISGSYHPPYYRPLLERFGLEKEVDYVEYRMDIREPPRFLERIRSRPYDERYTVTAPRSRRHMRSMGPAVWDVLEHAFEQLYGVVPLTEAQKDFYTRKYLSLLDPDFVQVAYTEGELIGFLIAMPNMSEAFRKAGGRLLPFGLLHLLRGYRRPDTVDLLLAGARSEETTAILSAHGLAQIFDRFQARGIRYLETNRELETNTRVNRLWRKFDVIGTRRSRVYGMALG